MLFTNFTRGFPNLTSSFICDSTLCSVLAVGVESEAVLWLINGHHVWSSVSSIWVRTKSYLRGCYRKSRDRKWPKWRDVTGSDVSHMTGRDVSHVSGSMLYACATGSCAISALMWPFDRKWRQSRDRKRPCPEGDLTGSTFCACPAFSPAFFLVVVTWLPDVTEGFHNLKMVKCINDRTVLSTVDVHWWMISNWSNLSIYFSLVVDW
jgi:hypothetical protein